MARRSRPNKESPSGVINQDAGPARGAPSRSIHTPGPDRDGPAGPARPSAAVTDTHRLGVGVGAEPGAEHGENATTHLMD